MTDAEKILPQPTPFSFGLGEFRLQDGSKLPSIRLDTVVGEINLAMPIEFMRDLAAALIAHADRVDASSLHVASDNDLQGLLRIGDLPRRGQ
jgi:hypothetical protein